MKFFKTSIYIIAIWFYMCVITASQEESTTPEKKSWYDIRLKIPLYISANESLFFKFSYIICQIIIFGILLIPISFLDGLQSCLTSGLGIFYWAAHVLVMPIQGYSYMDTVLYFCCCILGLLGSVVAVNDKFSNLTLSIGGAYVISILICLILHLTNIFLYFLTFLVFTVVFVMFKKANARAHFSLVKALILSLGILIVVELLTHFSILGRIYAPGQISGMFRFLSTLIFLILFGVVFAYTYFKENVYSWFKKK